MKDVQGQGGDWECLGRRKGGEGVEKCLICELMLSSMTIYSVGVEAALPCQVTVITKQTSKIFIQMEMVKLLKI